jgi:hypothetical protein
MKKFKITFVVTEVLACSADVKAENAKQAGQLFRENPHAYERNGKEEVIDIPEISTIRVVGEWIPDSPNSAHLERFKNPIRI